MGFVHHSRFLQYLEMGRVELFRSVGHSYADLEKQGVFFVVVKAEINFRSPAKFDDELTLATTVTKQTHVRFDHEYELKKGDTVVATAKTTIACVDRSGSVMAIPEVFSKPK